MVPCKSGAQLTVDTDKLPVTLDPITKLPLVPLFLVLQVLDQVQDTHVTDMDSLTKCSLNQASEATWIDGG